MNSASRPLPRPERNDVRSFLAQAIDRPAVWALGLLVVFAALMTRATFGPLGALMLIALVVAVADLLGVPVNAPSSDVVPALDAGEDLSAPRAESAR
jgi:hypothetical protein